MNNQKSTDWLKASYRVNSPSGKTLTITVSGRDRWALECLVRAGRRGCTPIEQPGPRWSGYIFNLRQIGVPIETLTEPHSGPFKGTHARYVLNCVVAFLPESGVAA